EDVIGQLKALRERKQLASPCTVVIDTTLDLDDSPELRALLRDPELAEMIQSGALNVVWHRSAQKFDMLGEDNYYGGVVCCLNNGEAFQAFNERIRHPAAQLGGIYYQGLTHLQKAIGAARDDYVRRLRSNAELLYSEVSAASFSDLKIAPMQEGSQFFLHLRLPLRLSNLATHVVTALAALLARKGVIVSHRGSFGFARTNIIGIGSKGIRITAGLEDADTIKTIAQAIIELASKLQSASDECASYSELQELLRELVASSNSKARGSPPTESEP
ncbi:MAG: hypothetical protein KDK78_09440, partial [Chlamydiia bacterium]|nr:hypothetical protein [Chlamydiia bacterium]